MDDLITWTLRGAIVVAANDAQLLMPHGNHQLLIKYALDILSKDTDLPIPGKVTVRGLPWPIKAIVEPNNDRIPIWAHHTHYQHDACTDLAQVSPFIYASRDHRLPMTKSLTFEFTGTIETPVISSVYPGSLLPPLPWQLNADEGLGEYEMSVVFWRRHSHLFDKAIAANRQDCAPNWFADTSSPLTLIHH